eukprot:gene21843-27914_t
MPEKKRSRNQILHKIRDRLKDLKNKELDDIATEMESSKSDARKCFDASRRLLRNQYTPFSIQDSEGHLYTSTEEILPRVTTHYEAFLAADNSQSTTNRPQPVKQSLQNPISREEVSTTITTLKNGRAIDNDGMYCELLKYTAKPIATILPIILNNMFSQDSPLSSLGEGILIPLNKPKKPKTVENTRPITIVNTVRKIFSLILYERIRDRAEQYISSSQSGFRRGRSTADIVWAYRWLDATVHRYQQVSIHLLGLDLSKAFDTVPRDKLKEVLKESGIAGDDELRMLDKLLDDIRLRVRVSGKYGEEFKTTNGIPQGDSLSPLLFIIYLEAALRDLRAFIKAMDNAAGITSAFMETQYADDADFFSRSEDTLNFILVNAPHQLEKWHLKMNNDKTERYTLARGTTCTTKKLGNYLDQPKDIRNRIASANAAFHKMWRLWFRNKLVSQTVRLRMYNAYIMPLLTYNIGALGVCATEMDKLDVAHRHHLRLLRRIHYPNHITNENLYKTCNSEPITTIALRQRWNLFGHVLRMPTDSPAFVATGMYYYEVRQSARQPGKQKTALPTLLSEDMEYIGGHLKDLDDLNRLYHIAKSRD